MATKVEAIKKWDEAGTSCKQFGGRHAELPGVAVVMEGASWPMDDAFKPKA